DGKVRRRNAVRSGIETLAQPDRDLVVDPAMIRIPKPGVAVFRRNVHVRRTGGAFEILQAPGVGFADWHRRSIRLEEPVYSPEAVGGGKGGPLRAAPPRRPSKTGKNRGDAPPFPPPQKTPTGPQPQRLDGKNCARGGPYGEGSPSRSARQGREVFERVFIAVLGVDRLSGAELDDASGHAHLLTLLADEVHLNAVALAIVERVVVEARKIEIAVELAIDAR